MPSVENIRRFFRFGAIAQLGERLHGMQEVSGSIPLSSTKSHPNDLALKKRFQMWGYSSAGRALAWHARGQRFDPAYLHHFLHPDLSGTFYNIPQILFLHPDLSGTFYNIPQILRKHCCAQKKSDIAAALFSYAVTLCFSGCSTRKPCVPSRSSCATRPYSQSR